MTQITTAQKRLQTFKYFPKERCVTTIQIYSDLFTGQCRWQLPSCDGDEVRPLGEKLCVRPLNVIAVAAAEGRLQDNVSEPGSGMCLNAKV